MKLFLDKTTILLRHYREAAGMSQQQVAEALKVGLRSYQRYESGESIPSIDIIYLLSKVLRFELKTFFAPQELTNSLPGFKVYAFADEDPFRRDPVVVSSKLLEIAGSQDFQKIAETGEVKRMRECNLFEQSSLPLSVSNPKSTLLNPVAQKLLGFSSDQLPTIAGHDDPSNLGMIWAILMDHETAFFSHEQTTEFPKGKAHWTEKGIFSRHNHHYVTLSALDFFKLPSKH